VSWYDCDCEEQTFENLLSGNQVTFCADESCGPIDESSGTLILVGDCNTTTTTTIV
jgi:hypothetical protein